MKKNKVLLEIHYDAVAKIIKEYFGCNTKAMKSMNVLRLVEDFETVGDITMIETKIALRRMGR